MTDQRASAVRVMFYIPELRLVMTILIVVIVIVVVALLIGTAMSVRVVKQYEQGVLFRLGKVLGVRSPGLRIIVPFIDVLRKVSLRIVTMPIQSQGIITRDNVSVDVSAVAYFRVVDAVPSTRSPRPRCERSSASTPWTRPCPRPTRSTWTSARSWTARPSSGASRSPWSS
jgi:hypothetical protein